jgi:hypothetical protein
MESKVSDKAQAPAVSSVEASLHAAGTSSAGTSAAAAASASSEQLTAGGGLGQKLAPESSSRGSWLTGSMGGMTSFGILQPDTGPQPASQPMPGSLEGRDALEKALDAMLDRDVLLMKKYTIMSMTSYAVKFFSNVDAFESESALYGGSVLRAMMPATREIRDNADSQQRAPGGYVFPPFIAIERGEPLDEWIDCMRRAASSGEIALVDTFQTLVNISKRLLMLHEAGYVHRDLKPSNVLWLSRLHAWTLIDFGCAARTGVRQTGCPPALDRLMNMAGIRIIGFWTACPMSHGP